MGRSSERTQCPPDQVRDRPTVPGAILAVHPGPPLSASSASSAWSSSSSRRPVGPGAATPWADVGPISCG